MAALRMSYLSSYSGMGRLGIECSSGCRCQSIEIDAHRGAARANRFISVGEWTELPLEIRSTRCFLEMQVLNRSSSGGFKFKLLEVAVHLSGRGSTSTAAQEGSRYEVEDACRRQQRV